MTDLILSRSELEKLTDTRQPARMVAWLRARSWVFEEPRGRGKLPKVSRSYFDARMSGQDSTPRREGPKLGWLTSRGAT